MTVAGNEAELVLAAAAAIHADPHELLAGCDVASLVTIAAEADAAATAVDAAAVILVGIAYRQPFAATAPAHHAAAWLAAAHRLAADGLDLQMPDAEAVALLAQATTGRVDTGEAARRLGAHVSKRRRRRRPASTLSGQGIGQWRCPACGLVVGVDRPNRLLLSSLAASAGHPVITALCARQHRVHDSRGRRPAGRPDVVSATARDMPPVVTAPSGPVGAFLALGPGGALVFVPGPRRPSQEPHYEVLLLADPAPGDLVGDWRRLVMSSRPRAAVPASRVHVAQKDGRLDVWELTATTPEIADLVGATP